MLCPKCKKQLETIEKLCPYCGEEIRENNSETQNNNLWDEFMYLYNHVIVEKFFDKNKFYDFPFYIEDETNFDKMSKKWLDIFTAEMVRTFFISIHKSRDLEKGVTTFYDIFICSKENYQYYYNNSPGFKFFIDNTPSKIIELFENDQLDFIKTQKSFTTKLKKIIRAILSLGISLFTGPKVDMAFDLFKTKDLKELAYENTFNASMYAIGYSKYWK